MHRVLATVCVGSLLSILAFAPIGAGQQSRPARARSPVTSDLPTQASKPSERKPPVTFKDGRLSVSAQGGSLEHLASAISDKTGVPVILDGAVARQSISVSFQYLPLDEGLRQIFRNNDAFFFYGSDKDEPSALKVVWVYPKGGARGVEPVPPEKWASTKELEQMLSDLDPETRGRAIEAILERKGGKSLPAVERALKDPDDHVRTSALYGASEAGVELPEEDLRNLALNDPSADVRFLALQSLADSLDAQSVAETALNDPSEPVRLEAQEILQRLSGNQSPQPGQTAQGQQQAPNQ